MIWGELINQIRTLHLELLDQYSIQPSIFMTDVELTLGSFPFPTAGDDYGEWDPPIHPEKILQALEFHPIERALIEGPLLPIQEVVMLNQNWDSLFQAILELEKEWLMKVKLFSPDKLSFIQQGLRSKFIQLRRQSGHFGLKAVEKG